MIPGDVFGDGIEGERGADDRVVGMPSRFHARWDRLVGERGFAMLAIGGNIVTAWSWFGTNQLGIGLHSYGFTSGVLTTLTFFVLSQLLILGIGAIFTVGTTRSAQKGSVAGSWE